MYPAIATVHPINMTGPLALNRSDTKVPIRTAKNPAIFGGTVKLRIVNRSSGPEHGRRLQLGRDSRIAKGTYDSGKE